MQDYIYRVSIKKCFIYSVVFRELKEFETKINNFKFFKNFLHKKFIELKRYGV